MNRRVVVTGLGVVSPLGNTVQENWDSLLKGKSGIGSLTAVPCPSFPKLAAGEIKHFKPGTYKIKPKSLKVMNRAIQYAIAATGLAVADAGLNSGGYAPGDVGLALGTDGIQYTAEEFLVACYEAVGKDMRNYMSPEDRGTYGPIKTRDPDAAVHPLWPLSVLSNMGLCHIAILHNFQGPNLAFSSSEAGGAQAVGEAFKSIRSGDGAVYIAGGSYALNSMHFLSLSRLNLLADNPANSRPFDTGSTGCVLGEGSAMLVLEELSRARKRGAPIYAEIAGFASLFDGSRRIPPLDTASAGWEGMQACMQRSLDDAGISARHIDYINADGKGIARTDGMEAAALRKTFGGTGRNVPVTTSKPLTGHMLAASGAFSALGTALAADHNIIPPTVNGPSEDCFQGIHLVKNALKKQVKYAMSNTFGFSGEHTSLILKKHTTSQQ